MLSVMEEKRQSFYQQIRQRHKYSIMQKIRYRVIKNSRAKILSTLIQTTNNQIHPQEFCALLNFISINETNSIIHLGNLLIDGVVSIQLITFYEHSLHLPSNEYTTWVLKILWQKGYFTQKLQQVLMKCLEQNSSEFSLSNGLDVLKTLIKSYPKRAINFINNSKVMNRIQIFCLSGINDLQRLSFGIISELTFVDLLNNFQCRRIMQNLKNIIFTGLLNIQVFTRTLSIQIVNNIMVGYPEKVQWEIIEKILRISLKEKDKVKVEISYLLYNFICNSNLEIIKKGIEAGLVSILNEYIETGCSECRKNSYDSCLYLSKKIQQQEQSLEIFLQLKAYNLYMEEDYRMDQ